MTRFRELRLQKGYTQEAFRKIYNERYNRNYTSAAISMIEHGKRMPELGALIDFADFYDVSLDYLLGRDMAGNQDHRIYRQLRDIMERLDSIRVDEGKSELPVVKEDIEMLGCLLQQSAVLAKRVELEDNAWYRF
ncbi:MAG: helix-turn-helix domain-containing protein [Anaerovibrio sp.]